MNRKIPLIYEKESFAIRGACLEVYNTLGNGFLESVYQESLELELRERNIPFVSQPQLQLDYKGTQLAQTFRPDLICYNKIIVELKAVPFLTGDNEAQVINYLKATDYRLGILVNFGHYPNVEIKRLAN